MKTANCAYAKQLEEVAIIKSEVRLNLNTFHSCSLRGMHCT